MRYTPKSESYYPKAYSQCLSFHVKLYLWYWEIAAKFQVNFKIYWNKGRYGSFTIKKEGMDLNVLTSYNDGYQKNSLYVRLMTLTHFVTSHIHNNNTFFSLVFPPLLNWTCWVHPRHEPFNQRLSRFIEYHHL